MKACITCGRLYPPEAGFCPVDGSSLVGASQAPPGRNDTDPRLGQVVLDRYEVRRVVADGGMGRVYEALDLQDRRRNVALKILHEDVAADPVQVQRFKREYEVSSQLRHERIVQVFDFARTTRGEYVMVMEFLFGEELRATLAREEGLSLARTVRMVSQIAIGLDAAHRRKLVHRDLKPDNIFLCQTREGDLVKLLDFGSVKDKGEGAAQLTVLGTTIGSPFYMSPEQAQGLSTLDHRADIWALGVIMFEALTGKVPFYGEESGAILLAILTKYPAPLSQVGGAKSELPASIDQVTFRAFRKEPELRYGSAGEMADALGRALGLQGDHSSWAGTQEGQLRALIDVGLSTISKRLPASEVASLSAAQQLVRTPAAPPPISLPPPGPASTPNSETTPATEPPQRAPVSRFPSAKSEASRLPLAVHQQEQEGRELSGMPPGVPRPRSVLPVALLFLGILGLAGWWLSRTGTLQLP